MPENHTDALAKPHWEPDTPRVEEFARRLLKLREMHTADTDGYCLECADPFPCQTSIVASGADGFEG